MNIENVKSGRKENLELSLQLLVQLLGLNDSFRTCEWFSLLVTTYKDLQKFTNCIHIVQFQI